jgi:hypothetical protein
MNTGQLYKNTGMAPIKACIQTQMLKYSYFLTFEIFEFPFFWNIGNSFIMKYSNSRSFEILEFKIIHRLEKFVWVS